MGESMTPMVKGAGVARRQHLVVASCRMAIGWESGVRASHSLQIEALIVSTISEFRRAVSENASSIVIRPPIWLSAKLMMFIIIVGMFVVMTAMGISKGYNIEVCPKVSIKGVEISNCLIMTKPG